LPLRGILKDELVDSGRAPKMDEKARCQSCGMPIHVGNFGTNASGSMNFEYCNICFQKGAFTDMDMTCANMIKQTTSRMIQELGMNEQEAHELAIEIVPRMKRWRQRF